MERLVEKIRASLADPNPRPTLSKQIELLRKNNSELAAQVRAYEQQKDAALREVREREQEVTAISERAAQEISDLRSQLATTKRTTSAAKTTLKDLAQKQEEASRLANLATAESATRRESEVLALSELAQEQNRIVKQQQYAKLQSLAAALRGLDKAPATEPSSISLPKKSSDYQGEDAFDERDRLQDDARKIASGLVGPKLTARRPSKNSPPDLKLDDQLPTTAKRASKRSAREVASRLSMLQPTLDMSLAIHYAIQIERQQGIRIPLRFTEAPPPPLGQYAASLPRRPRIAEWLVETGQAVSQGEPIAMIWFGREITTLVAPDNVQLVSQLVEKHGYIPTSGVIGYLQPL
jgi:hypothetical protein